MPIYEYACEKCGAHVEVMQKVGDPPLKRCRQCRGKLQKLVSRTSVQFKGSGWYVTDYASKSSSKSDEPADKSPAKETTSKEKKESPPSSTPVASKS